MVKLVAGTQIKQYRIVRKLGEGGMGEVFEAINDVLGRHVAIKILHASYAKDPQVVGRFFNEARAANQIDHPGMVQVYEFEQLADGTAYIVMEYLRGESLAARYRRGRLQFQDVARLGYLIADALAAAHARGIVHRDLKPDNVMIVADPNVPGCERTKILDFGIAKLSEGSATEKTRTAAVMGTPHFMSPEQCRGAGAVDDRADVYALGVILFIGISGCPPFDGEGIGEILAKHIYETPPLLTALVPNVPIALVSIVDGLLQKDRTLRPSMREVAAALQSIAKLDSASFPQRSAPAAGSNVCATALPSHLIGLASTLGASKGQSFKSTSNVSWLRRTTFAGCAMLGIGLLLAAQIARRHGTGSRSSAITSGAPAPNALMPPPQRGPAPSESEVTATLRPDAEAAATKVDPPSPLRNRGGSAATSHRDHKARSSTSSSLAVAASSAAHPPGPAAQAIAPVEQPEQNLVSPSSPQESLRQAELAYDKGQFAQAVELARLGKLADPERSWRLIGVAACRLGDLRLSAEAHRLANASGKWAIARICSDSAEIKASQSQAVEPPANGPVAVSVQDAVLRVDKGRPKAQPLTLTSASASAPPALRDAWSAFEAGNYKRSIELALAAKEASPQQAWLLVGIAACHLSTKDIAGRAFQKIPLSGQLLLSTVCRQHEILLDF